MSLKCYFQYDDGHFCKNWSMRGTRFCNNHQPPEALSDPAVVDHVTTGLAPVPIRNPRDVLRLLADTLNGLRTGATSPGRGYATACVARLWLDQYRRLESEAYGKSVGKKAAEALGIPYDPDPPFDPSPDPDPDPPATTAPIPPATPLHDPWAAGRMAGPVPFADTVEQQPPENFPALPPDAPINLDRSVPQTAPVSAALPHPHSNSEPASVAAGLPRQLPRHNSPPITLDQARAKLTELMGWKPDSDDEPLDGSALPLPKSRDPAA